MRFGSAASRIFGVALTVAVSASPAMAQIGRVAGTVKNDSDQPLKGATIVAENSNIGQSLTATTDDRGRFIMIGLRAGVWRFIAQAPGYTAAGAEMGVRMGAPNPPLTFVLQKTGPENFGPLGGISNKDLQANLSSAENFFKQGRWDDAVSAYRAILERAPTLAVINLQIAAAYRGKKDYTSALAAYNALLKSEPTSEKAFVGIAMTNLERGDAAAAEDTLVRAAATEGAGREVFYSLGELKLSQKNTAEAAEWYGKAVTADPYWAKPLYKLGLCAIEQGDTATASKHLTQAIAVDPASPEAALAKTSLESLKK
jgi:Flp pilus assembly protein TadD